MTRTQTVRKTRPSGAGEEERLAECRAQAALYGLVGRCLEEEVDEALLGLLRGPLAGPLAAVGLVLDAELLQAPAAPLLEALAEEYTVLFVAPGGVSPFASVFETGCMFREPADRAMAAYRAAGWDWQRRQSGEFPDHVGTLLAFLGVLAGAEAEALEQADTDAAARWRQQRESFLLEEIGPWVPGWCRRAAAAAMQPFYRQLLGFSGQLLWTDIAAVADRRQLRALAELNRREPKKLDYNADFRKASGL
jgi:TorA maturation chaperone TorD